MSTLTVPGRSAVRQSNVSAPSRRVFLAATRSEWFKLHTVRSTLWSLVFTVLSITGLGVLLSALEASRWDQRSPSEVAAFDPVLYSLAGINLAQLSIGVLGVLVMTSEYATGLIRVTLTATPQRATLLAAKVATFSAVITVVSLVSCIPTFLFCQALLPQHAGVSLADPTVLRAVLGAVLYLVLLGAIAITIGTLLRRTAGSVAVLFAVLLIVPGLITLLPSPWNDDIVKFLPSSAGEAIAAVTRSPQLLSPLNGLLVIVAYTAAGLLAATLVLRRRDA